MKYIRKIILKNFQSHKHTIIEMDEGLNIIVGPSDTGKSAIIRALKWVLYNEPSGDYFIREGESECSVSIVLSDGTRLTRTRGRYKNSYDLIKNNGEEYRFEGFGMSVPVEVTEAIGIKKIYLDDSESKTINLGEQLEGSFLLSEKSSLRASAIGRIIGVNIIDDALKETLRDLRNLSIEQKNIDSILENTKVELKKFDYLDELSNNLYKVKDIRNTIKNKTRLKNNLERLLDIYIKLLSELQEIESELQDLKNVEKIDKILNNIESLHMNYKYLYKQKEKLYTNLQKIGKDRSIVNNLRKIEDIEYIYSRLIQYQKIQERLKNIEKKYRAGKEDIINTNYIYNNLTKLKELESILKLSDLANKKLQSLILLNDQLNLTNDKIKIGYIYINNFINIDNYEINIQEIESKLNRLDILKKIFDQLANLQIYIKKSKNILIETENNFNSIKFEYNQEISTLKVCPFCFNNIDHEIITKIIDDFE